MRINQLFAPARRRRHGAAIVRRHLLAVPRWRTARAEGEQAFRQRGSP
jgi:hypothetical protein